MEESLANHFALKPGKFGPIKGELVPFCRQQPPAYRRFDRPIDELQSVLAAQILRRHEWLSSYLSSPFPVGMMPSQAPWLVRRKAEPLRPVNCPRYMIRRVRPSSLVPPLTLPAQDEVEHFLVGYLQGSEQGRTDHRHIRIDNGERIKVPNPHGNDRIKKTEFKNIHLKAGMTGSEYNRERQRTKVWERGIPRPYPKPPLI